MLKGQSFSVVPSTLLLERLIAVVLSIYLGGSQTSNQGVSRWSFLALASESHKRRRSRKKSMPTDRESSTTATNMTEQDEGK